jgi:hypothetical protein
VVAVSGQKVYPPDYQEPDFLDQSNHSLAAAAQEPFLNHRVGKGWGKPEWARLCTFLRAVSPLSSLTSLPQHP